MNAEIIISNLHGRCVRASTERSVLAVFQEHYIDWMHACGGKGRCTTCAFSVIEGSDQLSSHTTAEKRYLQKGRLDADQRLACQVRCRGRVVIEVPTTNQLPHIQYGYE